MSDLRGRMDPKYKKLNSLDGEMKRERERATRDGEEGKGGRPHVQGRKGRERKIWKAE